MKFEIPESDRQAIVLALAELSFPRPGWLHYLRTIAERFHATEMFDEFRKNHVGEKIDDSEEDEHD